mmetsp:Transcript_1948/g.2946  ORF Transcript_1948/g.2946 Transcript_1948/m.2946 type:complete len:612 (+) Transcript_1948:86-1921(+)
MKLAVSIFFSVCWQSSKGLQQESQANWRLVARGGAIPEKRNAATISEFQVPKSNIVSIPSQPIQGMKPGTSGVRKRTSVWENDSPRYVQNLAQALIRAWSLPDGYSLVLGGDGRYYSDKAIEAILGVLYANGCGRVVVPCSGGVASTPAISSIIRSDDKINGGILLTASHNPGGPNGDFGMKFNTADGAPAREDLTDAVYEESLAIHEIKTADVVPAKVLEAIFAHEPCSIQWGTLTVQVIDASEAYAQSLANCFDLDAISVQLPTDFRLLVDCMHGAAGPAAVKVLGDLLGDRLELRRANPLPDFGQCHPDPNLKWASSLASAMGVGSKGQPLDISAESLPNLGAALDGDGDRNMILGARCFVTPSDSLAILAANSERIKWFQNTPLKAAARSMPTSRALDRVAQELGFEFFETPTGWKYFGNLMDVYSPFLCGEESFGTGADHVREKDGLWAVLAWLSVLAHEPEQPASVRDIVQRHWKRYGRDLYCRWDFEGVDSTAADKVFDTLREQIPEKAQISEFEYLDPVDGSTVSRQGIIFAPSSEERAVFRLSGTGSEGATIRLYLERYIANPTEADLETDAPSALADLGQKALQLANLNALTGRDHPDVVT